MTDTVTATELRVYLLLEDLQRQFAAYMGDAHRGPAATRRSRASTR